MQNVLTRVKKYSDLRKNINNEIISLESIFKNTSELSRYRERLAKINKSFFSPTNTVYSPLPSYQHLDEELTSSQKLTNMIEDIDQNSLRRFTNNHKFFVEKYEDIKIKAKNFSSLKVEDLLLQKATTESPSESQVERFEQMVSISNDVTKKLHDFIQENESLLDSLREEIQKIQEITHDEEERLEESEQLKTKTAYQSIDEYSRAIDNIHDLTATTNIYEKTSLLKVDELNVKKGMKTAKAPKWWEKKIFYFTLFLTVIAFSVFVILFVYIFI